MLAELLLASAFQVGPFYEQRDDFVALRPFYAREGETTDVLWPLFTAHRDWWSCCRLVNWQDYPDSDGYQFTVVPFWFNGRDPETGSYAGLFPIYGRHPHVGMMYDLDFCLWPLWTRYRMPRLRRDADGVATTEWLETKTVLFPFVSWRSDGAWSVWPFYGLNLQRESDHRYALWPLVTWASYRDDRDTAGEGYSWMVWPFYGRVRRAYERQDLFLPPFFSVATAWNRRKRGDLLYSFPESFRLRCPWPFVEYEKVRDVRERLSVWPFYERQVNYEYRTGERSSSVMRFGWKLVEIYDDEVRVFPFYASGRGHFRIWPLWESETEDGVTRARCLSLVPIRWLPQVARNWSKFWTFYESEERPCHTDHSLLWGIIRWRTVR